MDHVFAMRGGTLNANESVLVSCREISGGSESKVEPRPARRAVTYCDAGAMRPSYLHNNRQAQTGTVGANASAAPEALEDALPILCRDTRTTVLHADRALWVDLDDHLRSCRRMHERVFDQIAQRICDRRSISN